MNASRFPSVARTLRRPARLLPAVLLAALLVACAGGTPASPGQAHDATPEGLDRDRPVPTVALNGRKLQVVTTVGMINDIVKNVGGERVTATALMGPGVDPHLYKASAGDVRRLAKADVIFYGGLDLEGRMIAVFEKVARTKPVFAVSEDIPPALLRRPAQFKGHYDPHIWFDVTLWMRAAEAVIHRLGQVDPPGAAAYAANGQAYLATLQALNEEIAAKILGIPPPSRVLITAHDAFGYFGQRYGMEVRGLQGSSTATEAGAADVRGLAELMVERRIKAIFVESSVPHATIEAVQAAARAKGWNVRIGGELFSDAMGRGGTAEGSYVGMVRHNVDTIVAALK